MHDVEVVLRRLHLHGAGCRIRALLSGVHQGERLHRRPVHPAILEKLFALSQSKLFAWSFWIYNLGLILTAATLTVHGMQQVTGAESSQAIAGIAGTGHMLLTAGMILLFLALRSRLKAQSTGAQAR
jgi:hypothetical protein